MKKIYGLLALLAALIVISACNDEWKDEQYEYLISFSAPLNNDGVSPIYVRYKESGSVTYKLPLLVSGSLHNKKDINVKLDVDHDTLSILNYERFKNRTDFYYHELTSNFFSIPETANIKAGESTALVDVDFSLKGLDLVEKWVLPLTISEGASSDYVANPRKHYRKALLQVNPFNDYSGKYGATTLKMYILEEKKDANGNTVLDGDGNIVYEEGSAIVKNTIPLSVVDENTVFFYAGMIEQESSLRSNYKIYASFDKETNSVKLSADNPKIKFIETQDASFTLIEKMDEVQPYLMHRYLTINNIGYEFVDYTTIPNDEVKFQVVGSITMERKINTQIPDEDQAIEWD